MGPLGRTRVSSAARGRCAAVFALRLAAAADRETGAARCALEPGLRRCQRARAWAAGAAKARAAGPDARPDLLLLVADDLRPALGVEQVEEIQPGLAAGGFQVGRFRLA